MDRVARFETHTGRIFRGVDIVAIRHAIYRREGGGEGGGRPAQ